jgi:hypothetical protein
MGYLLVAWVSFSQLGSVPIMKWMPIDRFYATSMEEAAEACLKAGRELKVKKFKCVKVY